MIVAVDGPAGTGKSSVAGCVADRAGLFYLNSGNFYRAVTWAALRKDVRPLDTTAVVSLCRDLDLRIVDGRIVVNGDDPGTALRSQEVDNAVAVVSSIPDVRSMVNARLRDIAGSLDLIAEGRDMTTVVFPDAEIKIYLDASLHSRAKRRYRELDGRIPLETIQDQIAERDLIDRTKAVGNLKLDPQALYIDTSHLTMNQVCEMVLRAILSHNHSTGEPGQS